ncbi:C40 family peptidase [uncultured Jatrophihabitans sp.]|uniref:C40 family peptidase n=1 Tax=uncultured Jatrophihabitans sp. TaxID=1610747 RepID=UPI0035CB8858
MHLRRTAARRVIGVTLALTSVTGVLVGVSGPAAALPPKPKPVPKVTQGQVNAAHAAQDAVATTVGRLGAQVAQEQSELDASRGREELAEQRVALAISQLEDAKTAAEAAQARVRAANQRVVTAHRNFVAYVQASYADGQVTGTTGSLLTAQDPTALVDRNTLEQYEEASQINAISAMQAATVARSNADAAARRAVQDKTAKAAVAKAAVAAAHREVAAEQIQQQQLQAAQNTARTQLTAAQEQLATLTHQRGLYLTYVAQQRAYQQAVARAAAEARAAAAARARAIAEQAAARRQQRHHHSGGGGGGGGGSSYSPPVSSGPGPGGGGWTAAKGRLAVKRAKEWLGTPYIWAGGNKYGPTTGGCSDPVAPCGTVGFDCSGLVLFAWDRGWTHQAAVQHHQAGSYHPSPSHFKPGDLLFWKEDGGIGHVAIYIGGGDVIQAPQSGDVVKITPWRQVQPGYAGATRPLT